MVLLDARRQTPPDPLDQPAPGHLASAHAVRFRRGHAGGGDRVVSGSSLGPKSLSATATVLTAEGSAAAPMRPPPKVATLELAIARLTVGLETLGWATLKRELIPLVMAPLV